MASFEQYKEAYERNWANLTIRPGKREAARHTAERLLQGKPTYMEIQRLTAVPWWFVGLCHYRESNFDFDTYLGNGQPLNRRTTIVPKGRGPFTGPSAFTDGAIDALKLEGFFGAKDWGIARVLYRLEGFNGYGYHGKGVNSPYLYGGSTCYGPPEARAGKYVADHVFDPNFVDPQLGTAVVLKALMEIDPSVTVGTTPTGPEEPDERLARTTLWVQQSLNRLGAQPRLEEDGKNGPLTMAAVSRFQQENGIEDSGLADAATAAAIERKQGMAPPPQVDALVQLIEQLEKIIVAGKAARLDQQPSRPAGTPPRSDDVAAWLDRLTTLLARRQSPAAAAGAPTAVPPAQQADQLRKAVELVTTILVPGTGGKPPLGQVNGALGETIGALLDGRKTAIGLLGAVLTAVLSNVPSDSGLGQVLAMLNPAGPGGSLSGFTMPVFLAMSAWGVLGKIEKWAQGTAPAPPAPK